MVFTCLTNGNGGLILMRRDLKNAATRISQFSFGGRGRNRAFSTTDYPGLHEGVSVREVIGDRIRGGTAIG